MTSTPFDVRTERGRRFADAVAADPGSTLLALDFDGTLAAIVEDPEDSRLHQGAATALAELGSSLGRLAIITGRAVEAVRRLGELDSRRGLERLVVLGQYGVERYDVATGEVRSPDMPPGVAAAKRDVVALLAELAGAGKPVAGVYLEDKGRAIGVHTRRAEDPQGAFDALSAPVADIARRRDLHVEPGRMVLELRAAGATKADALRELVDEQRPRMVAMVGDDLGDLPAFELLQDLESERISCCAVVSASEEQDALLALADVVCDGPDGVAAWLQDLAGRLG